jgi:uncharacterized damage-inducible protein DinB
MTNADFFAKRWESEQAAFRKVIAALPADKLEYRPHERSTAAGALAWQLVDEQFALAELMKTNRNVYSVRPVPSHEQILAEWDRATEEVREALKARDDAAWDADAQFLMDGQPSWTASLRDMLWGFLFDMIHHRGQLSAYIRPMGGKVPAIYGPSADAQS